MTLPRSPRAVTAPQGSPHCRAAAFGARAVVILGFALALGTACDSDSDDGSSADTDATSAQDTTQTADLTPDTETDTAPDVEPDSSTPDTGADLEPDSADAVDVPPDAVDVPPDAPEDSTGDAPDLADEDASELPDPGCDAACQQTTLNAQFGEASAPFDRAFFGLSAPETTTSGEWEIYIEAQYGGSTQCPDESSPTPERTLILTGLAASIAPGEQLSGLGATLIDYDGALLGADYIERGSSVSVTAVATELCIDCVGQPAPAQPLSFVALELTGLFPRGTIDGHLYAIHCDSMDLH